MSGITDFDGAMPSSAALRGASQAAKRRSSTPTIIHVNMHVIKKNRIHGTNEPPLTVRRGRRGKTITPAHEIEIHGPSKIVHSPHEPLPCGARVWIETFAEVTTA